MKPAVALAGASLAALACINNPFNDKPPISVDGSWLGVDSAGDTLSLTLHSTATTASNYEMSGTGRHAPARGPARSLVITLGTYNHDVILSEDRLSLDLASSDSVTAQVRCTVTEPRRLDAAYWVSTFGGFRPITLLPR